MRATATKGVYAYGDVASYSTGSILDINDAVRPLCSSIRVDLSSDPSNVPKQLEFVQKSLKETQIIPVGPKGGVGAVFGWRVPSLMVWAVKSRTFMVDMAPGAVAGKDYIKA